MSSLLFFHQEQQLIQLVIIQFGNGILESSQQTVKRTIFISPRQCLEINPMMNVKTRSDQNLNKPDNIMEIVIVCVFLAS